MLFYSKQKNIMKRLPDKVPDNNLLTSQISKKDEKVVDKDISIPPSIPEAGSSFFNSFIGVNRIPLGAVQMGERIGGGKFGDVHKGTWGNRSVALKSIGTEGQNLLKWEIARLSALEHPNIVQFYGIYQNENQGLTYLVMEFCEGGTLEKQLEIQEDGKLSDPNLWQSALEISQALAYLHGQGVLHRDLKVDNILFDNNGRAKLSDLGIAQVDELLEKMKKRVLLQT